jgi:hypothetical protein
VRAAAELLLDDREERAAKIALVAENAMRKTKRCNRSAEAADGMPEGHGLHRAQAGHEALQEVHEDSAAVLPVELLKIAARLFRNWCGHFCVATIRVVLSVD